MLPVAVTAIAATLLSCYGRPPCFYGHIYIERKKMCDGIAQRNLTANWKRYQRVCIM